MSGIGGYIDQMRRRRAPSGVQQGAAVGAGAVRPPAARPGIGMAPQVGAGAVYGQPGSRPVGGGHPSYATYSVGDRSMPSPRGGPGQGHGSLGFGGTRGGGAWDAEGNFLGEYGTHVLGTNIDAGSRRVGSANYGAMAGLQNFIGANGQAGIDYLRSMGISGSYNGQDMFAAMQGAPSTPQWTGSTGTGFASKEGFNPSYTNAQGVRAPSLNGGRGLGGGTPAAGYFNPAFGPGGGAPAGSPTGGPAAGGIPGIGGDGASELDGAIAGKYMDLMRSGGGLSDDLVRRNVERGVDTVARGTSSAVEQARLDAARRGVTLGADREARIRQRGASAQAGYRDTAEAGFRQEQIRNLLGTLGGAGGFAGDQRRAAILLAQLQAQSGQGALPMILGL